MPNIVHGNLEGKKSLELDIRDIKADYSDKYPNELDLRPDSTLHKSIKDKILERARESNNVISARYDSWNEIDKVLTAYIKTSDKEKELKEDDERKPVSILFPYSYAMMETMLSYLVGAFFQDPIFMYEGFSPEDTIGAALLELVVQLHCVRNKIYIPLHVMFRDALSYGMGVVSPDWVVRTGYKRMQSKSISIYNVRGEIYEGGPNTERVETVVFEGNSLKNIDPYMFLPDPNVGTDIQSGEYVGWIVRDNYMNLLREEEHDEEMFNVKYLRAIEDKTSVFASDQSEREKKTNKGSRSGNWYGSTNRVDVISMYIDLIPSEWKLSDRDTPERWYFELAGDVVLIKAQPANFDHNMFNVALCAPEFDGYTPTPISRLELMNGMQGVLDFLFNSHIENVRKAINDMLVVDPYLVNINDVKDPKPGKMIRLRRPAWGRGVDKVIQQLQVNDITRANLSDSVYISQWMERVAALDQSVMGGLRQTGPERLTKAEFQGTRGGNISRLERVARIIGLQAMQDIGYMFASNTQQLMEQDVYVKAVGRYQEELIKSFRPARGRIKVTPFELLVDYDVVVRDGSVPGLGGNAEALMRLFSSIVGIPELYQDLDVPRMFLYIAKEIGAKNVEDFKRNISRIKTEVVDNEEIDRELDRGNIVPIGA